MLQTWLAVIALIFIGILSSLSGGSQAPAELTVVTSTPTEVATESATTTVAATTTKETPVEPPALPEASTPKPSVATTALPPAAPPPVSQETYDATTQKVRDALVNILCETNASSLHSTSGSGAFIDSRGIIITAAHVAQLFLLKDYPEKNDVRCVVRTGSPARDAYAAVPIYISESWVRAHPDTLTKHEPGGTGEHDFALLAVTASASIPLGTLPSSFPALPLKTDTANAGTPTIIGSYAAQFISSEQIISSLYPTLVFGSVKDVFTFRNNTIDLLSLGGSAAAQLGSSGGVTTDAQGNVIGLITTSTLEQSTASRDLRAITPLHMRASFLADTNKDLDSFLASHDLPTLINAFHDQMASLTTILIEALQY